MHRQAADPPHSAAEAEDRGPQGADLHSDDAHVGRAGAIPQLPRTHLPPLGWQHPRGTETGERGVLLPWFAAT